MAMDPATASLIIRGATELVALAIPLFRRAGRSDLAEDLTVFLSKVNARYDRIIARADEALGGGD